MATQLDKIGKLSQDSERRVVSFASGILHKRHEFNELFNKMDAIDVAYARYKMSKAARNAEDGVDTYSSVGCDIFADDDVTPPIVVSQVDSYVAYLAEVFLSGSPIFPVVSNPTNRTSAEKLEALIDNHASLGGYARQLLMFLRDGCKYNFSAIEAEWDAIEQFSVLQNVMASGGQTVEKKAKKFTRVTRLNPRNVVWDWSLSPGDVSEHGDYAGYIKRVSRTKFKRLLNKWSNEGKVYNADKAMMCGQNNMIAGSVNYKDDPVISHYVSTPGKMRNASPNWDAWFDPGKNTSARRGPPALDTEYELFYLYARIMPADFGITAPARNTPQIWKFVVVNNQLVVHADRVISAFDQLPILFGQPLEDGLGYQTQSIAEGEIPFQEAASKLFNIRFAAARRAVSDRALYIPDMIKPSDINSKTPAPKIPVNISALSNKSLGDSYMQIPFDMRGTETTINDAQTIVSFSKELHGLNSPRQGQFQKGNKSVQEWNDTMGGSEGRLRLPALTLEHQVFSPLKSIIVLNILQYGEDGMVTSQVSGKDLDVKISELRDAQLTFKVADGYTPSSKIASTEVILAGIQMISNSPLLQQAYGPRLPNMFAHFMSLSGLKGFDEYSPDAQQQPAPGGLSNNVLTTPTQPVAQPVAANAQPPV